MSTEQSSESFPLVKPAVIPAALFEDVLDAVGEHGVVRFEGQNVWPVAPMLTLGDGEAFTDASDGKGLVVVDADYQTFNLLICIDVI